MKGRFFAFLMRSCSGLQKGNLWFYGDAVCCSVLGCFLVIISLA